MCDKNGKGFCLQSNRTQVEFIMKDLKRRYGFKWINNLCVQINGVEYNHLARVNNKTILYIRNDNLLRYRILDKKDCEEFCFKGRGMER